MDLNLSDCSKCHNTPCICGAGYQKWSPKQIERLRSVLKEVLIQKYIRYTMEAWQNGMAAVSFELWSKEL